MLWPLGRARRGSLPGGPTVPRAVFFREPFRWDADDLVFGGVLWTIERSMAKRDLITGGAGFIGSHLAEALVSGGRHVTVLDDLSTGRFANVEHLSGRDGFRMVAGSVCEDDLLEDLVRDHDRVFHLASAVGVRLVIERPIRTIETNVAGTAKVLKCAARYRRPVLLTSTSEVYGKSAKLPFREEDDVLLGPTSKRRWAYACSKMLDEFLARAHWVETRLPVVIVRLFNTVGPRQTGRYGMVLPTFVRQALRGEALTVFGDGEQKRCFCDVADIVPALVKLMDSKAAQGQVVNLGGTTPVTMNELARRVLAVTGSSSEAVHVPYEEAYPEGFEDIPTRVPDITKARDLVGFHPEVDLGRIIGRVAQHLREKGLDAE